MPKATKGNKRHLNQYSDTSNLALMRYEDLLNSTRKVWSLGGNYCCYILEGGQGFHKSNGYYRMNFAGRKIFTHVFVWEYHNGVCKKGLDISHLCQNKACCRPEHLHAETREENLSRNNCKGFIVSGTGVGYSFCNHTPACKIDAKLPSSTTIVNKDV